MTLSAKAIAEEYTNTVWNEKDMSVINRLMHEDLLIHSSLGDFRGPAAMKEIVAAWLHGFPNLSVQLNQTIAEKDLVVIQWSAQGIHQGNFKHHSPTGKSVSYSGVTIYNIQEGKIIEYWAYLDLHSLLSQLS